MISSQTLIQEPVTFITSQTFTQEEETLTSQTSIFQLQILTQGRETHELLILMFQVFEQEYKDKNKESIISFFIKFLLKYNFLINYIIFIYFARK